MWERDTHAYSPETAPSPVNTRTSADSPAIMSRDGFSSNAIRTGTRCVTLTQLPVAFCAGSTENSLPVPEPIVSTWPRTVSPGSEENTSELQSLMRNSYDVLWLQKKT